MKKKSNGHLWLAAGNIPSSDIWAINEMKYKVRLFPSLFSVLVPIEVAGILTRDKKLNGGGNFLVWSHLKFTSHSKN